MRYLGKGVVGEVEELKVTDIVAVVTRSLDSDEEQRFILVRDRTEDAPPGEWNVVVYYNVYYAYHCSCYGFDDAEWEGWEYTENELIKVMKGWLKEPSYTLQHLFGVVIERYLEGITNWRE